MTARDNESAALAPSKSSAPLKTVASTAPADRAGRDQKVILDE